MSQCCRQFFEEEDCKVKLYWMRIAFFDSTTEDKKKPRTIAINMYDKYLQEAG
jgi:hypothetical protein